MKARCLLPGERVPISEEFPTNASTTITLEAGDKVGQYVVGPMIASAGFAAVYRATDEVLGRTVAIKQLLTRDHPDPEAVLHRARTEGAMHKRAAHDEPAHLVQLIDIIDDKRGLMLVVEYVDGPSLEQVLSDDPEPMETRRALGIIAAVAKALHTIHARQIIHRDLKPANILTSSGGDVKISDFGLSALIGSQEQLSFGTPRYMAPELLRDEPTDARADIYSLGMIAYEMLAGRAHFSEAFKTILRDTRNQDMRWVKWHINPRSQPPALSQHRPDLDPRIEQLVTRMLAKEPGARPESARQVLDTIQRIVTGTPTPAPAPGSSDPATPASSSEASKPSEQKTQLPGAGDTAPLPQRRSKLPLILAGVLLLWVIVGGVLAHQISARKQARIEARIDEAVSLLAGAETALDDQRYADALSDFESLNREYGDVERVVGPGEAGALLARAELAMQAEEYDDAVRLYREARQIPAADKHASWLSDRLAVAQRNQAFGAGVEQIRAAIERQDYDGARAMIAEWRRQDLTVEEDQALRDLSVRLYGQQAEAGLREKLGEAQRLAEAGDEAEAMALLQDTLERVSPQRQDSFAAQQMRKLLGELEAATRYDRTLAAGEEAAAAGQTDQAIELYRQALEMRATDAVEARLAELEAERFYQQGQAALAVGDTAEAERLLTAALGRNPDHAEARQALSRIESAGQRAAFVRAGDDAMAAGEYDTAIKQYLNALRLAPDDALTAKLDTARVRLAHLRGMQALETGDLETARKLFESAAQLDPDDAAVQQAIRDLDAHAAYYRFKKAGDEARAHADFGDALNQYRKARNVMRTPEIAEALDETEHAYLVARARAYIDAEDYLSALGMLRTALNVKDTQEVRQLMERLQQEATEKE